MARCDACSKDAGEHLTPRISPLEKALHEIEQGLLKYKLQPGDSLVRHLKDHGLPAVRRSMILSDLLRKDIAREPQVVSSYEALARLSRISSQHDVYNSHWVAPRRSRAEPCDSSRLEAFLADIELTSDATVDADAWIETFDLNQSLLAKEHYKRWNKAHGPLAESWPKQFKRLVMNEPGSIKVINVPEHPINRGSTGYIRAGMPQVNKFSPGSEIHPASEMEMNRSPATASKVDAPMRQHKSLETGVRRQAPHEHDGVGTHFRPMLEPADWSVLAIQGTPLGHIGRLQQRRPEESTVRLDTLQLTPAESLAYWKAEGPRGKRTGPAVLASKHLIGHWQRDIEAEAAAAQANNKTASP
jgi:hypothetical protein